MLVLGQGEKAQDGGTQFSDERCLMWTINHPTLRCDIEGGTAVELLCETQAEPEFDETGSGEGAVLIQGEHGATYFIPGDLDQFEMNDEQDKSELLLLPVSNWKALLNLAWRQ